MSRDRLRLHVLAIATTLAVLLLILTIDVAVIRFVAKLVKWAWKN